MRKHLDILGNAQVLSYLKVRSTMKKELKKFKK